MLASLAAIVALLAVVPAGAVNAPHTRLVSVTPASFTPRVLDGQVNAIVQVGNMIVAGGVFTQVREAGGPILDRANLFAFNAATGAISSSFVPNPDGEVLALATDGTSVFVGGSFGTISGQATKRIAKLNVQTGSKVPGFDVVVNAGAAVYDMAVANGRVYIGGAFSKLNGVARSRIASLNTSTGALDPGFAFDVAGKHNEGTVRVHKLDVSPDGTKLVAIGNFLTVDGASRRQVFMLNLTASGATLASWQTSRFEPQCTARFDTYMRDVDFSPDGSYFVIGTTGAFVGGVTAEVLCDTVTRWETSATGSGVQPTWADYTGGDTTFSVASTGAAIYVGGHQRWWNNPFRADSAGPGAVSRPGIAALDPVNGLPFSWNPIREPRGRGVFALVATSQGLWLGSDTCGIAGVQRCRIAFMPLAGGAAIPPDVQFGLPNDLYTIPATSSQFLTRRSFTGTSFGSVSNVSTPGTDWSQARGSFITNGKLYSAWSDGRLLARTFNGSTVGPAVSVGLNGLTSANFPVSSTTGMFFRNGRIYYTVSGDARLFYRYFTPESEVVGAVTFVASGAGDGLNWSAVRGMTLASGRIYFARTNGNLYRMNFSGGVPVPGSEALLSGPSTGDGRTWDVRDLFIFGP